VTLRKTALAPFRAFLEERLARDVEAARQDNALLIDAAMTATAATSEFHATIANAGPFGAGNPEPIIALPSHAIVYAEEVGQAHVRVRLKSGEGTFLNAIAFRTAGQKLGDALLKGRGQRMHVAGSLAVDRFQGQERVQLRIIDVAGTDPVGRA
jgi:single-stranded-DNA-specific exonuclease